MQGVLTYQSIRPCKHGHLGLRYCSNSGCVECHKIRALINEANPQYLKARTARRAVIRAEIKRRTMAVFGSKCACCGEDHLVFLTVDHRDGRGAEHRRSLWGKSNQGTGNRFYKWVLGQAPNFILAHFRCLCFNCNLATHILGECPHAAQEV